MENASKALIIAASVLIVIVLIAVGIKILGSTSGAVNEVGTVSGAMGISVFNSQFTDYAGNQKGSQVKALLNKAAATYRNGSSHKVKVAYESVEYNSSDEIATVISKINVNNVYKVEVGYDDNYGYVDEVKISISR